MVSRKITIDNSVRYIQITEKTKEKEIKPKTIKVASLPRKKDKIFSKTNIKKFIKDFAAGGFGKLTK